jgi:CheY-like chemotaxis protein
VPEQALILLVEDEFLISELVEYSLLRSGYAVHREPTGDKAIAQLDATKGFVGLVTDIRMPGQATGWDVARHARGLNPSMAVVYTSADSGPAFTAECVPGSTFVQKPFMPDQVTAALSTLLKEPPK